MLLFMASSFGFYPTSSSSNPNYDVVMRDASPVKNPLLSTKRLRENENDDLMSEESPSKKMRTPVSSAETSPSKFWFDSTADAKDKKNSSARKRLSFALDEVAVDDGLLKAARNEIEFEMQDLFYRALTPLAFSPDPKKPAQFKQKFLEKKFSEGVCLLSRLSEQASLEAIESLLHTKVRSSVKYILSAVSGLQTVLCERKKLSFHECLAIAAIVEERFCGKEAKTNIEYLSKTESGVARALVLDHAKRQFLVLSKKEGFLYVEGAERKVSSATLLAKEGKKIVGKTFARLVNIDEDDVEDMEKQATLSDDIYQDVFMTVKHTTKSGKQKISIIEEQYERNLEQVCKEIAKNSSAIFFVMKQTASTVSFLHNNSLIHGDIKGPNIVLKELGGKEIAVKLSDFGATYNIDGDWPRKIDGIGYASSSYSSPESYGAMTRLEDKFEQAKAEDMYALGCVLYTMLFPEEKIIPWGPEVDRAVIQPSNQTRLVAKLKQQKGLELIKQKALEESDPQRKMLLEICRELLEMDPTKRMKIDALQQKL
jgi:hypothetical protein